MTSAFSCGEQQYKRCLEIVRQCHNLTQRSSAIPPVCVALSTLGTAYQGQSCTNCLGWILHGHTATTPVFRVGNASPEQKVWKAGRVPETGDVSAGRLRKQLVYLFRCKLMLRAPTCVYSAN